MIIDILQELMETQNYCMVATCDYPLEGFITNVKDENVEMYIFSAKTLEEETEEAALTDRIIERIVFPIAHIDYIFPDHYLRLTISDLETKKLLKNQILNQRKIEKKPSKKITKKTTKKKEDTTPQSS